MPRAPDDGDLRLRGSSKFVDLLRFLSHSFHPNRVRGLVAFVLVVGVLVIVYRGMDTGVPASAVIEYVSPVSTLAGLAVGYYFGATRHTRDE
jgi:hypothetical protein